MRSSFRYAVFSLIVTLGATPLLAQESFIREESWEIKTYPFFDPNPIPIVVVNPEIYPYFTFDGFSHLGSEQSWKVVRLENDYLQVFVLPEIGGKVWGALERSTGNEFIYRNEVIKFRHIAMRGPWTSGGIEFNFGLVGHAPTVATPVDYVLRKNEDGSVSCFVGAMDLASRTRWHVEIRLPKDKAYFETRSSWYNRSPFVQSYYNWSTAAVSGRNDLQYLYPGRHVLAHNTFATPDTWPVDRQGHDLSWYKNNNFGGSKSHFVYGQYAHFFGGYWHHLNFGYGHWARYNEVPGQKVWIWALSREGAIWENLLTDTDGQYSEPQAGRLFNQSDHEFFPPYSGDTWTELWFPIKDIGGVVEASPYGVLNAERDGNEIKIGINALQTLNETLVVTHGTETLYRGTVALEPMETWQYTLNAPTEGSPLQIAVGNRLFYTDDPDLNVLYRPFGYAEFDTSMTEERFRAAAYYEKQREYDRAMAEYRTVLSEEPYHLRALTRLASLYGRRGDYEEGLSYAARALEREMYDPDANYAYGVLARRLGQLLDAKETLGWAARSMAYRANALTQIAEIYIQENNFEWALDYAKRALRYDAGNNRTLEALVIIYRKLGSPSEAKRVLAQLEEQDPLNHLIRFERYLADSTEGTETAFTGDIRNELPHESFLELAVYYHELGLDDEAVRILRMAPGHPMVVYWLAYLLRQKRPAESNSYLAHADGLDPALVFPFREESIPVFKWASSVRPNDWKARYYLGLIYWGKGRKEEAARWLDSCGQPDFAPYYVTRAQLGIDLDSNAVLSFIQKAVDVDPDGWRYRHHLVEQYTAMGQFEDALTAAEEAFEAFPEQIESAMDYAGALFDNARYAEALAIFNDVDMLPYEGSSETHDLFMRTQVYLALERIEAGACVEALPLLAGARSYPEHLGSGMPFDPDFNLQDYLESYCRMRMNEPEQAKMLKLRITEYTNTHWDTGTQYPYFGALALNDLGERDRALQFLQELENIHPENQLIQWSIARFTGDLSRARELETDLRRNPRYRIQIDVAAVIDGM